MNILLGVIVGIIVLTILVVAHELGHALVARRYGTVVEEFGIGFPPKAWGKKLKKSILGKDVLFSVNWLPLGGFVKMQGEHDDDTGKGDYGAMTFWQKTQVLLAGVVVNWLLAVVLITILALVGIPKIMPNQFSVPLDTYEVSQPVELVGVTKDLPAAKAGLKDGDQIIRFAGSAVTTADDLAKLTADNKGKSVVVEYKRDGKMGDAHVTLRSDNGDKKGFLGVEPAQREVVRATWSAPIVGVCTTAQFTWLTLQGLGQLIGNTVSGLVMKLSPDHATQKQASANLAAAGNSVAGPLAIFGIIFPAADKMGPSYVIMIAAVISLTLAVMNALPIPALDGGRWFVTALYRVLKQPLTKDIEERIHGTGFIVLMLLVVVISIADIGKLNS
jgi:regulator of sigma E protease